jgi:hypothetical protein
LALKDIFGSKKSVDAAPVESFKSADVRKAIDAAFEKMQKTGTDRIVLSVSPGVQQEAKDKAGGWIESRFLFYYPKETLCKAELEMINQKIDYQVITLCLPGNAVMPRPEATMEIVDRVKITILSIFPRDYFNDPQILLGKEGIDLFVKTNEEQKFLSASAIAKAADEQIAEYKEITRKLVDKVPEIQPALEKLEKKEFANRAEQLLSEIRGAIESAKKN